MVLAEVVFTYSERDQFVVTIPPGRKDPVLIDGEPHVKVRDTKSKQAFLVPTSEVLGKTGRYYARIFSSAAHVVLVKTAEQTPDRSSSCGIISFPHFGKKVVELIIWSLGIH